MTFPKFLLLLLIPIIAVFWLSMLVDCLKGNRSDKVAWVIVILFLPLLGAALYFWIALGRSEKLGYVSGSG